MGNRVKSVVVVGAGPVGLLTALMLGQRGIPVDIVEAAEQVNTSPRALAYGPSAVRVLRRAGVLESIRRKGLVLKTVSWRDGEGEYITGLEDLDDLSLTPDATVAYPCGSLVTLLLEEVKKQKTARIYWRHTVKDIGQDDGQAWVHVEDSDGSPMILKGDFVIGCDGARSRVRKQLFGASFPGYTWPVQMIAVNIYYPFDEFGWEDCQWIIHPHDWFLACKITNEGLWRIAYGEEQGATIEQAKSRLPDRFRRMLPGHPEPEQYEIANIAPYAVQQRLAERMAVGRILLAGDAAHLNNPMGGLGLTTGISDVGSLVDCLLGINDGLASVSILDKYNDCRREIFSNIVDVASTVNFKRIMQDADQVIERDPFLQSLEAAKTDLVVKEAILKHDLNIGCDMTQFYDIKTH